MNKSKVAWECNCGAIAYGKLPPAECLKCDSADSFIEADEDQLDELTGENLMNEIRSKSWGDDD
ncbi:hypothetical protein EXS72_00405 [Candidatus Pacearchaeota archaeon]|nr:hypothetical protein [Candidatus Pacearchaeota archaeon]